MIIKDRLHFLAEIDVYLNQLNLSVPGNYTVYILPATDGRIKQPIVGTGRSAFIPLVKGFHFLDFTSCY